MLTKILSGTLPIQGSDIAGRWDTFYAFLFWMSFLFFAGVIGAMIYFAWAYRARGGHKAKQIHGHVGLEITWTVIPTLLVMLVFVWGYAIYRDMATPPGNAYEIRVIGKQWLWQFQYDDGRTYTDKVFVPVNKPVKLIMTSEDVLHSFFIPNMRVKKDVVPGMYTTVWFEATTEGEHQVYCAEYCGTDHSGMLAKIYALSPAEWSRFVAGAEPKVAESTAGGAHQTGAGTGAGSLAERGRALMQEKGCVACHNLEGTPGIGPSLKGAFGQSVEFADGSKLDERDENYIRESIENPQAKIVKGFQPVMPTFKGVVTEQEMNAIIAFIKSWK